MLPQTIWFDEPLTAAGDALEEPKRPEPPVYFMEWEVLRLKELRAKEIEARKTPEAPCPF